MVLEQQVSGNKIILSSSLCQSVKLWVHALWWYLIGLRRKKWGGTANSVRLRWKYRLTQIIFDQMKHIKACTNPFSSTWKELAGCAPVLQFQVVESHDADEHNCRNQWAVQDDDRGPFPEWQGHTSGSQDHRQQRQKQGNEVDPALEHPHSPELPGAEIRDTIR